MSNYLKQIKDIISNKAGIEPAEITEDSYFEEDLNIGEMELLEILSELEEALDVELIDEKDNILSVSDLVNVISDKLD